MEGAGLRGGLSRAGPPAHPPGTAGLGLELGVLARQRWARWQLPPARGCAAHPAPPHPAGGLAGATGKGYSRVRKASWVCAMVKSGSSPGSGFTSGKGLRPRSGAIAAAAAAGKAAAPQRARGVTLGPAARSERLAPGGGVGEGRGERAARTRLLHCWRRRARAMERDARAQNSHAQCRAAPKPPANLRYGSPRSAVTTRPQLHRRKLLKNGGRFPSSPRSGQRTH